MQFHTFNNNDNTLLGIITWHNLSIFNSHCIWLVTKNCFHSIALAFSKVTIYVFTKVSSLHKVVVGYFRVMFIFILILYHLKTEMHKCIRCTLNYIKYEYHSIINCLVTGLSIISIFAYAS